MIEASVVYGYVTKLTINLADKCWWRTMLARRARASQKGSTPMRASKHRRAADSAPPLGESDGEVGDGEIVFQGLAAQHEKEEEAEEEADDEDDDASALSGDVHAGGSESKDVKDHRRKGDLPRFCGDLPRFCQGKLLLYRSFPWFCGDSPGRFAKIHRRFAGLGNANLGAPKCAQKYELGGVHFIFFTANTAKYSPKFPVFANTGRASRPCRFAEIQRRFAGFQRRFAEIQRRFAEITALLLGFRRGRGNSGGFCSEFTAVPLNVPWDSLLHCKNHRNGGHSGSGHTPSGASFREWLQTFLLCFVVSLCVFGDLGSVRSSGRPRARERAWWCVCIPGASAASPDNSGEKIELNCKLRRPAARIGQKNM